MNDSTVKLVALPVGVIIIPEIVAILCTIFGFVGNFLTVLTILFTPKLKKNANNWFVCNLSVVDALFCVFALPIQVYIYHNRSLPWGDEFCVWLAGLKHGLFGTALFTLCTIAFNRYIHVVHPDIQPRLFRKHVILLMILLCWVIPFSIHMAAVTRVWGHFGFQPQALICAFKSSDSASVNSHRIVMLASGLGLPTLFMGYCYTRITFVLQRSQKRLQQWSSQRQIQGNVALDICSRTSDVKTRPLQLTKTMMIICALFVFCIAPYSIVGIFDPEITCPVCHLLTPMMSWIQISLNPIIYTITNSQFHEAYNRMFLILTCQRPVSAKTSDMTVTTPSDVTTRNIKSRKTVTNSQFHEAYNRLFLTLTCQSPARTRTPDMTVATPSDVTTRSIKSSELRERETSLRENQNFEEKA